MDDYLQSLIDAPLANPNGIYLPAGKRSAKRAPKPEYDNDLCPPVARKELRARADKAKSDDLVAVLDYYATTTVPFERIAQHVNMSVDDVEKAMKRRNRLV